MSAAPSSLQRPLTLVPTLRRPPHTTAAPVAATAAPVRAAATHPQAAHGRRLAWTTAAWMTIVVATTMGLASVAEVDLLEPPADAGFTVDAA